MKIIVLGAGVIGTTTAYYLARDGHEVHVIERQKEAAMETSHSNGGVIHTSEVEPWSKPGMPQKVLSWIGRQDAPMLLNPSALPSMWLWGLKFIRNCTAERYRRASQLNLRLALLTLKEIKGIREECEIEYDLKTNGSIKIFRDKAEMDFAERETDRLRAYGMQFAALSPDRCIEVEPALAAIKDQLVGALYAEKDEHGDCQKFTIGLRKYLEGKLGVTFHFGTTLEKINRDRDKVSGITTSLGEMTADAYVSALASHSSKYLSPVGVSTDIYPAKGISVTVPADNWPAGPKVPVLDISKLFGLIKIGNNYRCSGSVEFNGWDTVPSPARAQSIVRNVIGVFPDFSRCYDPETAVVWCGLRPMSASGSPYVGQSRLSNLYLNCGHGHLGWTMSCGSSRLVSDIILGRKTTVEAEGLTPATHI
jgi:D-amino-acid dehydrogenase